MNGDLSRIAPRLPPGAFKTYGIFAPLRTHWRSATCAEVDCPDYLNGWKTIVPAGSELADMCRNTGRHFTESPQEGGLIEFIFPAGQKCFRASSHRVQNGRPERFIIRDGDWRGNPTGRRSEVRVETWTDDFGEHQERLADQHKEG